MALSHLPLLLNPFLNALYNHPRPQKSKLHGVINYLATHNDSVALLVPSTISLYSNIQSDSKLTYTDLCHNDSFISSHIIDLNSMTNKGNHQVSCKSLNGKEVMIGSSGDYVITGNGFPYDQRIKIVNKELFTVFNDYMEFGMEFLVVFLEKPLLDYGERENQLSLHKENHKDPFESFDLVSILREFPLVFNKVSEEYRALFRDYKLSATNIADSVEEFNDLIQRGVHIFEKLNQSDIDEILTKYPINLHECVFNYIESKLYPEEFPHLMKLLPMDSLNSLYSSLDSLSITQVGIPYLEKNLSIYESNIVKASKKFSTLTLTDNSKDKCLVFIDTFQALSSNISIDADTLVGLLLMVIVRCKVPNLSVHLQYVKQFSFDFDTENDIGFLAYVISTFEGVLDYLNQHSTRNHLILLAQQNKKAWDLIKRSSVDINFNHQQFNDSSEDLRNATKLQDLLRPWENEDRIPHDSFIWSRNSRGESLLAQAIISNNYQIFHCIIQFDRIFTMDDLIKDKTLNNSTLFSLALNTGNDNIIYELSSIFEQLGDDEKSLYLNITDSKKRNIGHYLNCQFRLFSQFGLFIDWTARDINLQTPLFITLRSYDHPDYEELVVFVLEIVFQWYEFHNKKFSLNDHIDHKGNTLLHIVTSGKGLQLILDRCINIDVNILNGERLTPLMLYVKYNRLENIKVLLEDKRVSLLKTDGTKYNLMALDYVKKNPVPKSTDAVIEHLLDSYFLERYQSYNVIDDKKFKFGVVRIKIGHNDKLFLFFKTIVVQDNKETVYSSTRTFDEFKLLIRSIKLNNPNSFLNYKIFDHFFDTQDEKFLTKFKCNIMFVKVNSVCSSLLLNDSTVVDDVLWKFLSSNESLDELRLNHIKHSTSTLQPEEIANIKMFCDYSRNELVAQEHILSNFFKMQVLVNIKSKEYTYLKANMLKFHDYEILQDLQQINDEIISQLRGGDNSFYTYQLYLLRMSTSQMISNIDELVNHSIKRWWEMFGLLMNLNDELLKFIKIAKSKSLEAKINEAIQLLNDRDFMACTLIEEIATKLLYSDNPLDDGDDWFLNNLFEKRRVERTYKLLEKLKAQKQKLLLLNTKIKQSHEELAVELNNFNIYKSKTIKFLFRQLSTEKLHFLRLSYATLLSR
ncbi:hypothetical protein LJB42_002303 [Komagataella kurtzmanii]|nr:hypothetical protein LJB42_002303 [Komagataella kurtzmanii]